jgi:hypothetical protein
MSPLAMRPPMRCTLAGSPRPPRQPHERKTVPELLPALRAGRPRGGGRPLTKDQEKDSIINRSGRPTYPDQKSVLTSGATPHRLHGWRRRGWVQWRNPRRRKDRYRIASRLLCESNPGRRDAAEEGGSRLTQDRRGASSVDGLEQRARVSRSYRAGVLDQ